MEDKPEQTMMPTEDYQRLVADNKRLLSDVRRLSEEKELLIEDRQPLMKENRVLGLRLLDGDIQKLEKTMVERFANIRRDPELVAKQDALRADVDSHNRSLLDASETIHKMKGRLDKLEGQPVRNADELPPTDEPDFGEG